MYFYLSRSIIIFYAYFFIMLSFLLMETCTASAADKDFGHQEVYPAESKSESDKEKINVIQSEIDKINQDLGWLSSRIKKMELFNQFVPDKMYQSQAFKRDRITILTKLKEQLEPAPVAKKIKLVKKASSPPKKTGGTPLDEKVIEERIRKYGLLNWLEFVKDKDGARIENRLPVLFASGSAEIAEEYKAFLKNVAMVLKGYSVTILANGHADTDPIHTVKYPSNSELGAARASNVVQALVKNGISPSVFKMGTSSQKQFATHKSSKWKALNRRVDLIILLQS